MCPKKRHGEKERKKGKEEDKEQGEVEEIIHYRETLIGTNCTFRNRTERK